MLETSLPGVFADGDVRHGAVQRVASAVGEGAIAIMLLHQYLARRTGRDELGRASPRRLLGDVHEEVDCHARAELDEQKLMKIKLLRASQSRRLPVPDEGSIKQNLTACKLPLIFGVHAGGTPPPRRESKMVPASDPERLEVLFIADDPGLAEMYRLKLELDGYWVRVVGADTAVAEARGRCPEIVFLDLPAGHPERLRILRDLRDAVHRPELPAVVLTTTRGPELENQGASVSACDYLIRIPMPATSWEL